jgi:hypothetical protein
MIENPNLKQGLVLQTLIQKFETPRINPPSFFYFFESPHQGSNLIFLFKKIANQYNKCIE